ncbi:methylated-DNA--[protein]-cysteine S-methyltransferase [Planococcus sp. CP5-4]|uniref:methylated-DNA--[protein]-cysteine S-methyltransferase n=1 Tax=unclassified Planococcus (in: firmicutes) TaxID=2662419 RepID=UPI001C2299CD|nr:MULTISPECIES: methylated-DNA--[protein]-cysteine S-methyltransferase [unclassified Planococcus (in: firmicutes)]MBU9674035.1 methylated-DNA--[protein]-cysteine S-methyltransferase [Planococcus sp. CP5-4_YE]MBV0909906.1 methylated-DNA--[protein]-cysteine S-methyltransferase [Planococcus sp. CP5-4_UN]MBW6064786.1 methylated-DNA--[protein]-cysteine S-methyltransferase [Planococcus sp. CP5-4]
MNELHQVDYLSPIGVVEITATEQDVVSLYFSEREQLLHAVQPDTPQVLKDALQELDEYFKGQRTEFTVPCISSGTEFQQKVWAALPGIPYGETASYRDIARTVGNEKSVRAVGNANSKNKISIIIPCHRIIGSNGKLTGYAGNLTRKEWLLKHEQMVKGQE